MKQGRTDRDWAVVALMAFAAGAVIVWAALSKHPPQPRPPTVVDWPAWVQAVGSVGAILSAIAIAAYERSVTKSEIERQERLAMNARYTRGHRAVTRFKKALVPQRKKEVLMKPGDVIHPIEVQEVPEAMLLLEHDCYLMGDAGAACLNAVRCFENAQDLISHSMIRWVDGEAFFESLRLADQYCDEAIKHFVAYLIKAKN